MARLALVLALAVALSACGGGDDSKDAKQAVRDFVQATNARDGDRLCGNLLSQEYMEKATGASGDKAESACKQQLSLIKGLKLRLISIGAREGRRRQRDRAGHDRHRRPAHDAQVPARQGGRQLEAGRRLLMATVVVKLGSSIVADDAGEVRTEVLATLCDEVAARHAAGDEVVVVTSGAIARGMRLMGLPMRPSAMEELQAASAVGQGKLYRHYDELLQDRGVKSAQVLLTFFDMSARTHYLNARHTLRKLLDWRVVPVINENDTTTTDEISFGDNDFLAAQVAILIGADRLVLLTDIDGLYSADPRTDPSARADRGGERHRDARLPSTSAYPPRRSAPGECARRSWPPRWPPPRASP